MKKITFLAAICAALVACNKENLDNPANDNEGLATLTATIDIPQTKVAPNASELASGTGTLNFHWEKGDVVTITHLEGKTSTVLGTYELDNSSIIGKENPTTATFKGPGTPVKDDYVQYNGALTIDEGTYTVEYIEDSFRPSAMGYVNEGGKSFTMSTINPVLKLQLKGSASIKRIGYDLTGKGSKFCYLVFPTALQLSTTAKIVYFPLASVISKGTTLSFYDESDIVLLTMKMGASCEVNKIYTMPELTVNAYPNVSYYESGTYCGDGKKIGNVIWAPVNCGYDATHTYGSLYQWGRKYGQYYENGQLPLTDMTKADDTATNSGKFGKYDSSTYNWFSGDVDNTLWTENSKGTYDPCPAGWRIPTKDELNNLRANKSSLTTNSVGGVSQNGYWFSGGTAYSESAPRIFLPAAGYRNYTSGNASSRGSCGYYWSSSVSDKEVWHLDISGGMSRSYRAYGRSVRCVKE